MRPSWTLLLAVLWLAGASAGCDKEKVRQAELAKDELAGELKEGAARVKAGAEKVTDSVKDGAEKLNERAPELQERAKEGLEDTKEGLGRARDKVKGALNAADEKVDETVEKARRAGE
jgi:ElaB/YqjD/DUF883 family membrane-anchored ribosome-binding protein